jgi:hypothetical protein
VVSYGVILDVPVELVRFMSGLLADHRREIGTRKGTRRLGCYRQALFGLACFRDKGDIPRLGAGVLQAVPVHRLPGLLQIRGVVACGFCPGLTGVGVLRRGTGR